MRVAFKLTTAYGKVLTANEYPSSQQDKQCGPCGTRADGRTSRMFRKKKKKKVQITELIAKGSTADPRREASGSPSERRMNVHCVHSLLYMYKQFCECCGKTASSQPLSRGREEPRSEKAIPKWVYPRAPPPLPPRPTV